MHNNTLNLLAYTIHPFAYLTVTIQWIKAFSIAYLLDGFAHHVQYLLATPIDPCQNG